MRRVRSRFTKSQAPTTVNPVAAALPLDDGTITTPAALAMIQALIPLGLKAVEEALVAEVTALAGPRYQRDDAHPEVVRWGQQAGLIYLADQKVPITVPRVRDRATAHEVPLPTYTALQTPRGHDVGLFRRVLGGLSCREYEAAAEAVPEAFGLGRSSVSRRFIRASARELRRLQERRLDDAEWLVLVLDGKSFAGDQLVVALGVTATGEKRILGLVQTASENKRVLAAFLRGAGRARLSPRSAAVGRARRREGTAGRGARGARRRPGPALSVAQARECRELSRARRSSRSGAASCRQRRPTRLRRCETGPRAPVSGTTARERVGRGKSGRRA